MTTKGCIFSIIMTFFILLIATCVGAAAYFTFSNISQVDLKADKPNILKIGFLGVVEVDENPTTGYVWIYKITNDKILRLQSDKYISPKTNAAGAGGKHVWKFEATGKGTTSVIFEYRRPWEKDKKPSKTLEYKIRIE